MKNKDVREEIGNLREWLATAGYCQAYISHFNSTTNQLIRFMDAQDERKFSISVGLCFLAEKYGYDPSKKISKANSARLRTLQMLSEFKLHGAALPKQRVRTYIIPESFWEATEGFLAHRRFVGIVERNMNVIQLYLERFFGYLAGQNIENIPQITILQIHGFVKMIVGFSKQTRDHMLRTVRQFMQFCYENGYHPTDLSKQVPSVHYEKRSSIPSAYSAADVHRLLEQVDRNNPIGKRDYAILLITAKLGLRSGDICNLKFENIDWEQNKISLVQHKTGRTLTLPLFEDVGLALIDYLRFGRPECNCQHLFVRHRAPIEPFISRSIYSIVAGYISKAGLLAQGKKRGPHALRHSLASRLLEENIPLPVISEILGHADTNTTAVYLTIDIEKLRACALEV